MTDNARARFGLNFDRHGRVSGEADVLLPLYDTPRTLFFTQLGVRSMAVSGGEAAGHDRWIGNLGLGQRFFPNADEDDSGNWMIGYNAFLDRDFTRSHNRGGVGVELQYDWLRLSSNAYFPLSGWKDSHDFDRRLIEERPARGWDARVKAFLPFDRHFAFTGGFTQWYGDKVDAFGHQSLEKLEKNPRIWDYGLEYTPVPLFSASVTQQRMERGQTETRFGLSFTLHFDMPLAKQLKPASVAERRNVSGTRYELVDRENRIILEYGAKKNAFRIEYLGCPGVPGAAHRFRLLDGFGEIAPRQSVTVTSHSGDWLLGPLAALATRTDGSGGFGIELEPTAPNPTTVTIRAGTTEEDFDLCNAGSPAVLPAGLFVKFTRSGPEDFTDAASKYQSTVGMTVMWRSAAGVEEALASDETVTWNTPTSSISGLSIGTEGVWKRDATDVVGLTWGETANGTTVWTSNTMVGSAPSGMGSATHSAALTDVVGSRTITVTVSVGNETSDGDSFTFGKGPLSVFSKTGANDDSGNIKWSENARNNSSGGFQDSTNTFPAAAFCGGSVNRNVNVTGDSSSSSAGFDPNDGGWSDPYLAFPNAGRMERYAKNSGLAKAEQLLAVAVYDSSYHSNVPRKGAALAAGWSFYGYNFAWTGEVDFDTGKFPDDDALYLGAVAVVVFLATGNASWTGTNYSGPVAVCAP